VGQLDGQVVLVTGASRGQGRSHAIRFADEGADVIVTDICSPIPLVTYPLADAGDLVEPASEVEKHGRRCLTYEAHARDGDTHALTDHNVVLVPGRRQAPGSRAAMKST